MIGLDTNVLVRYIMQDDAKQAAKAGKIIESLTAAEPGFVSIVSIVELVWVLSGCFELTRDQVATALSGLLRTKEIVVDRAEDVGRALRVFAGSSADFADCLIERIGASAGCNATVTFDVRA
ncbi:MAG: type II toxin-antitoxin system VapC family toxin, partial [Gammaproteobacteria bacterium]|nr:type II toxin-antitoxin system VapC family toxin [Gammaproteobacteria bacterium]